MVGKQNTMRNQRNKMIYSRKAALIIDLMQNFCPIVESTYGFLN